ncbi:MAG TPA: hypothetical protein VM432_03580 [Bdellovibrionales bacterium]|nr:hypothetical protein [Bdellovibrionales bacterium]
MLSSRKDARHYRVLRYFPSPGHGTMKETLGEHLSLAQAENVVRQNLPVSHLEELVISDENLPIWESELEVTRLT